MASTKKMKYDTSFLNFGFSVITSDGLQKPQCLVCFEVLAHTSLKPIKLKRHLETNYPELVDKNLSFFQRMEENLQKTRIDSTWSCQKGNNASLEASNQVAFRIAKAKKPHTIGEQLIAPACRDIVSLVLGEDSAKMISSVPLSNDTISGRILDMSNDILIQVVQKIGNSKFGLFAIQLDEKTDVVNFAQLAVYVRYIHESKFEDYFLFCETIDGRTTAKDVFNKVDSFFQSQSLKWNNLCGIFADGAPAMLGCRSGFQTLVKQVSPRTTGIHCTIHRQV